MRAKGSHFDPAIDAIVQEIVDMMLNYNWKIGRSHNELMAKYPERNFGSICAYASQAGRFIRMCRGKVDEIRDRVLLGVDEGIELARKSEMVVWDNKNDVFVVHSKPDLKALKDFLQFQAEIHGILGSEPKRPPPESVEVPLDDLKKVLRDAGVLGVDALTKKDSDESDSEADTGGDADETDDN